MKRFIVALLLLMWAESVATAGPLQRLRARLAERPRLFAPARPVLLSGGCVPTFAPAPAGYRIVAGKAGDCKNGVCPVPAAPKK